MPTLRASDLHDFELSLELVIVAVLLEFGPELLDLSRLEKTVSGILSQ